MRPTDMVSLFRDPPGGIPAVRHEFGAYYCSLPDISLISQFSVLIVPDWLHEKKAWVRKAASLGSIRSCCATPSDSSTSAANIRSNALAAFRISLATTTG